MNTSDGFVQRTEETLSTTPWVELAPGDFNGDGHMDLYGMLSASPMGTASSTPDHLLINDGTGVFTAQPLPGDAPKGMGFDTVIFDWQQDGDADAWVVNDQGARFGANVLWGNEDGELTDESGACNCGIMQSGMGGDVGDYNNDGVPDLYGSATAVNALLEGQPDGTFLDVTLVTQASPLSGVGEMSWGAIFLDYDNDGRQDLLVAEGDFWYDGDTMAIREPMSLDLLRQEQTEGSRPRFVDTSSLLGDDLLRSWRAVVARDLNQDGVLDLLVTDITDRPRLFLSEGCTKAGWLEVHAPIGSQVDICADGLRQTRWSSTESSWGGAATPSVHFGIGDSTKIDRLQIRLPSGEILVQEDLAARRIVHVSP